MEAAYRVELRMLTDIFRKHRLRVTEMPRTAAVNGAFFRESFEPVPLGVDLPTLDRLLGAVQPRTVYKISDGMQRRYLYLLLPDGKESSVLIVGPYLSAPMSPSRLLELAETVGIPPQSQRYFDEYYAGLPVMSEGCDLLTVFDTFCEHLWSSPAFSIVDVDREYEIPVSPINEASRNDNFEGVLVNMKTMETRYQFENELIRAVRLGQLHKENLLVASLSDYPFEKRVADPLRNAKNYCIIMNTLLRKAAEEGGVHPVYLNNVSSGFALKIEQMASLAENALLMREMFRSYCRLVRKHSMGAYSLPVQKAILLIDSDLSANLTLRTLADQQKISSGYLATVFKRETGKTVSEYIREKRILHAAHLLATTHLQVQTVALHCGIVDVQYFSKVFKRQMGKTPKEYRESVSR